MNLETIQTKPRPLCPVCTLPGEHLYSDMGDKIFNTPWLWTIKQCKDKECKTVWLDPTPEDKEIYKLYRKYSTHEDPAIVTVSQNIFRQFLEQVRSSLLCFKYGYGGKLSFLQIVALPFAFLHPGWKDSQEVNIFYLPAKENGLLLDVGCGGGGSIKTMEKRGWRGVGIDFDEKAIENAKKKGLDVRVGDLISQKFPSDYFDAILMNHVIEHLPNPKEVLRECRRVLKKNGVLVAITPNSNSRGFSKYGKSWRGLETPTHLQVFSVTSLGKIAEDAGFSSVKNFSSLQGSLYVLDSSRQMQRQGTFDIEPDRTIFAKIVRQLRWLLVSYLHILSPGRDEVAVIVCKK